MRQSFALRLLEVKKMGTYHRHGKPKTRPYNPQPWSRDISEITDDLYRQIYLRAIRQAERVGEYGIAATYADAASRIGQTHSKGRNSLFAMIAIQNYDRVGLTVEADALRKEFEGASIHGEGSLMQLEKPKE